MSILEEARKLMGIGGKDGTTKAESEVETNSEKETIGDVEEEEEVLEDSEKASEEDVKLEEKKEVKKNEPSDPKDKEISDLKRQLDELRKSINEMVVTPENTETPAEESVETVKYPAIVDLFKEEGSFDNALATKEEFVKVLEAVSKNAEIRAKEAVMRNVIPIIQSESAKSVAVQLAIQSFFNTNRDLVPYSAVVSKTFDELIAAEPDSTLKALVDKLGVAVRTKLALSAPAKNIPRRNTPPVRRGSSRPAGEAVRSDSSIKSEVNKLKNL